MARRDSMADVMEALGMIAQAATTIHATDVAARMDTLRIEAEKAERLDERQWRKELTDESREDAKTEREQRMALALLGIEVRAEERRLDRESEDARAAQSVLLKEYYSKMEDVEKTEDMYGEYSTLKPSDIASRGDAISIIKEVDGRNQIDAEAINQSLKQMGSYQTDLETGLDRLKEQGSLLNEMAIEYGGINKVIQDMESEFGSLQKHLLTPEEEGGLGYKPIGEGGIGTAGLDKAFYSIDPLVREQAAWKMTERITGKSEVGAANSYGVLQVIASPLEGETELEPENLSYVDANKASSTYGKIITPSEEITKEIQSIFASQPDYDDFMTNFYTYEVENPKTAQKIRNVLENNLNTKRAFANLERDYDVIRSLEDEMAGINKPDVETKLDKFKSDISGVTDQEALFTTYKSTIKGLSKGEHAEFFTALEDEMGVEDAWPEYSSWLNPDPAKVDLGVLEHPETASLTALTSALSSKAETRETERGGKKAAYNKYKAAWSGLFHGRRALGGELSRIWDEMIDEGMLKGRRKGAPTDISPGYYFTKEEMVFLEKKIRSQAAKVMGREAGFFTTGDTDAIALLNAFKKLQDEWKSYGEHR